MNFGRKYVEIGSSCSHKLATFFKYHMPLRIFSQSILLNLNPPKTCSTETDVSKT